MIVAPGGLFERQAIKVIEATENKADDSTSIAAREVYVFANSGGKLSETARFVQRILATMRSVRITLSPTSNE
jgi:hypothetical protein